MADPYSKKAKYWEIVNNQDAVKFHAARFENGQRDQLAKMCFTHIEHDKYKSVYEKFQERSQ